MKHNSIRQMWQALRVFMLLFACCVSSIAWGQGTNSVKGHITDGNGEPLIGVSILVKNTNTSNPQLSSSASFLRLNVLSSLN